MVCSLLFTIFTGNIFSVSQATLHYDVIIIGAGASGLFCAFTAAKRGRRVLVIEKSNKVGKKILMSGGGKCNFTNHFVEADNFISRNPHFCKAALKRYSQWDFISMVEQYDIRYEERDNSRLFCLDSAKNIVDMLLTECEQAGVEIQVKSDITQIKYDQQAESEYQLELLEDKEKRYLNCDSLVVATGALSIPSLGGSGLAYEIAQQFDIALIPRRAGLVPFMFSDGFKSVCERLSGLALEVELSCNGQGFIENILFTHRGLSGPVSLQVSNYWHAGDEISVDLLPYLQVADWLLEAKKKNAKTLLRTLLSKKLAKALVNELQTLFWLALAEKPLAEFSDKQLISIGNQINNWTLKPSATEGYRTAEVTLGGVDTDEISSKTMEVKRQSGLYFIGESLDVTGHLGGYNFQWAWSSGYSAGLNV